MPDSKTYYVLVNVPKHSRRPAPVADFMSLLLQLIATAKLNEVKELGEFWERQLGFPEA